MRWCRPQFALAVATLIASPSLPSKAHAQESDDLRAKTQNPVGSLYSVPLENNFDFGAPNGGAYILNIQPVIPITVGGVNLINRVIIPIASVEGFIEGLPGIPEGFPGDGATGLGDINYSLFLSPANPAEPAVRRPHRVRVLQPGRPPDRRKGLRPGQGPLARDRDDPESHGR